MRISRSALILLLPLLLSLLLSACGDGGAASTVVPSSPKAEVLMHVDEVDSSGRVEMRHNFSTGDSANEEIITTTQDPGIDGVWGTADDWRTLETRCVFQPGGENIPVDEIMPFESTFYFWLTPQACTWRRPLTGSVDIEMTGMLLPQYFVEFLRDSLKSESDPWPQDGSRELLRAGDVLGVFALWEGEPMKKKSSLRAEEGGTVSCLGDCQPTETATPELADCYRACSLFGETLPPSGVGSEAMEACGNEVQRYNGTRYMTFYANGYLRRVVESFALDQPLCFPSRYTLYDRDTDGRLQGSSEYTGRGEDNIWFTADDQAFTHMSVQTDGDKEVHTYSLAGEDGLWNTADDEIGYTKTFMKDAKGRREKVASCYASGPDGQWGTPDDTCKTWIFHYGVLPEPSALKTALPGLAVPGPAIGH